jgi:hypothetical protein
MRPLIAIAVASIALLACKSNSIVSSSMNGACGASTDCRTDQVCGHDQMCHPACSDAGTCPDPTNACIDGACYPAEADAGQDAASTCVPTPNAGSGMIMSSSGTWEGKPIPQKDVLTRRGSGQMSGGTFTFYGSVLEISFTSYAEACGYAKAGHVAPGSRIVDVHLILWNLTSPGPSLVAGTYTTDMDGGAFNVWIQVNTVDATSCSADGGTPKYVGPVQATGTVTVDTLSDTYASGTIDITAGSDTFKASYAAGDCVVPTAGPALTYACCAP